ncbi:MAG: ABC transporter permease, partial [Mesorhizobium sp.]
MLHDIWMLMVEKGWLLALLRGAGITLLIGFVGVVVGLAAAIPLAILRWRQVPGLSQLVDAYSIVIRGVPGLLVIYLLFFGSVDWVQRIASAFGYADSAENAYPFLIGII